MNEHTIAMRQTRNQVAIRMHTRRMKRNSKNTENNGQNWRNSRGLPCFGGALKVFCISPRMEMRWMTQWSLQWCAFFKSSTSSLPSSNSTISGFFRGAFCFLLDFKWLMTVCWGPRFCEPSVRSIGTLGVPWTGAANPNPGSGGM